MRFIGNLNIRQAASGAHIQRASMNYWISSLSDPMRTSIEILSGPL